MGIKYALSLCAALALAGSASATVYRAGLKGGYINSYDNVKLPTVSIPDVGEVFLGPVAATNRTSGLAQLSYPPIWVNTRTWSFHGEMYFDGGKYYFGERMDDMAYVAVDGKQVLKDTTWNNFANASVQPTAGWHTIDIRLGNGTGGAGYCYDDDTVKDANGLKCALGVLKSDVAPESMAEMTYPEDPGDGTFFRVGVAATYIGYESVVKTDTGYSITIKSLAPSGVLLAASLGDAGRTASVTSEAVEVAPNDTATFALAWSDESVPFVFFSLGSVSTEEVRYWEESDPFYLANTLVSTVSVSGPARVLECEKTAQKITVSRNAADAWQAVTVNLNYGGDLSGILPAPLPSAITFGIGETTKEIEFTLVDDAESTANREFTVSIATGEKYVAAENAASIAITVVDDESNARTLMWSGAGDGTSWADGANWDAALAPTAIDTAVFGAGVARDLTVTLEASSVARLVRVATSYKVYLGAGAAPVVAPMNLQIAEGSGEVRFNSSVSFGVEPWVCDVAAGATLRLYGMSGSGDLVKKGAGCLTFSLEGDNNRTGGKTTVEAGRIEFSGNKRNLGGLLVLGGCGEEAVAYSTYGSQWNYNPMSFDGASFTIKDKGVLDLSKNTQAVQFQTMSRYRLEKGGLLRLGNTRLVMTGKDTENFYLEGEVTASNKSFLQYNSGRLVIPSTREEPLVWDGELVFKCDYFNGEPYEGGTVWGNRYSRIFVEDIPGVAVDFVQNGALRGQSNGDGFDKRGAGVMKLTSSSSYGGRDSTMGMTRVQGGTLLLDNDPLAGSATGRSRVEVSGGNTLGGTGRTGGLAASPNATLNVTGKEGATAVVHPGTIDSLTGGHITGTLTAGSADQACPTAFNDYGQLTIGVTRQGCDALVVNGKVTISGIGTVLKAQAENCATAEVKGGTYTILSATEGIEGDFASIDVPKTSWKVSKVISRRLVPGDDGVDVEEEYVNALTLAVPGQGLMIIVR